MRLLVLCWATTVLAGCTGAADAGELSQASSLVSDEAGAVRGTVVSEELAGLPGATVKVYAGEVLVAATNASAEAVFAIGGLTPGTFVVEAVMGGYFVQNRSVEVAAGSVTELGFVLTKRPAQDPYLEFLILRGFSMCDFASPALATNLGPTCHNGQWKPNVQVNMSDSWQYVVVEMEWNSPDSMAFYTSSSASCIVTSPCYAIRMGFSPLRLEGAPGWAGPFAFDGKTLYPETGFKLFVNSRYAGMFQQPLNSTAGFVCTNAFKPGCIGVGVSTGIPFNMYVSIFHYARPSDPAAYSGVPDS